MDGSDERSDLLDEIRVKEDGKTVYWGNAGVAGASRSSRAGDYRARSTTSKNWYYRRGWLKLKKCMIEVIPR